LYSSISGSTSGQVAFGNAVGGAVLVVNRDGLAPVALAAENGVAQAEVDFAAAQAFFFEVGNELGRGLRVGEAVDEPELM
jgi:hypothetical protein